MGKVVERRKKKKGRPSLLDLQKRTIKEQQQLQQTNSNRNSDTRSGPNSRIATTVRRSTRRNTFSDTLSPEEEEDGFDDPEDDEELTGKHREKKLKLVLRLTSQKSSLNSPSLNSGGLDSNAEVDDEEYANKKRKINAIGDGSGVGNLEKGAKSNSAAKPTTTLQGAELDFGPSTPLPDEKLLLFILDRLQKKDTYGVFSEPVDPEELPDYREVIKNPMDFATVRKKLASRAYAKLEEFEKDVILICSNAMQYNAPDTIYFRQARSILELAKKSFRNLRQDSDDNEPEPKVVRRGRPPTKNLKQPIGQSFSDRASSELSDATLATGGENRYYDLRKGPHPSEKAGSAEFLGKFPGSRITDANSNWLNENRFERNNDFAGSLMKSYSTKQGKKQIVPEENRRNTYKQFQLSDGGLESSVMSTFTRERKQLMAVGLHSDHGYARSLARFAANLGSIAWKVASKKIEKSLPAGGKFGRGWVGENDVIPTRPLLSTSAEGQLSILQPFLNQNNSSSTAGSYTPEIKDVSCLPEIKDVSLPKIHDENISSEKDGPSMDFGLEKYISKPPTKYGPTESPEPLTGKGYDMHNSSMNPIQSKPSFQVHKSHLQPGLNGCSNSAYGFNPSDELAKLTGSAGLNLQPSQMLQTLSRTTNTASTTTPSSVIRPDPEFSQSTGKMNSGTLFKRDEALTPQTKVYPVPPDLNVGFQSPGSPSSSRVDSAARPDLALQL